MYDTGLTAEQQQRIEAHFGKTFIDSMVEKLERYSERWQLRDLRLIEYYSINCLFRAESLLYGPVVLKICQPNKEVRTEIDCLSEVANSLYCRLYDFNLEDNVLLLEAIKPGTALRAETSLEKRIQAFSSVHQSIHVECQNPEHYPTYQQWVQRIAVAMLTVEGHDELRDAMQTAARLYETLQLRYPKRLLLHGDLHHDNILLDASGNYRVIDPKGVIGDPVFDVPRFILNEYRDDLDETENRKQIEKTLRLIQERLQYPLFDLKQIFFIETAMGLSWSAESGEMVDLGVLRVAKSLLD